MEKILNLGKYLFPLSFLLYVALHFGKPDEGAGFVPSYMPWPLFWNYFTGILILAFIICCLMGKFDKLAATFMALYVFLMIGLVHVPRAMTSENDMLNIFRNVMVVGSLLIYAKYVATDSKGFGAAHR